MHNSYLNLMLLFARCLLPSRFFRTLPKTVLPADQLGPQPQDINGYPGPPCPKPPATPGALCQFHSQFPSTNSPLPKFIPQLPQNESLPRKALPLIPFHRLFLSFNSLPNILSHLFNDSYPLFNDSYPLFNVCYPTHIRKF